ncbi:MAG: carotenoid oxygenase family protein, partial [Myxococcota bacterium]
RLVQSEEIEVPGPTMMHDWNVTRNHVIFMDLPMVFDLEKLAEGGLPIRWSDDYGARLGVMPREGSNHDVVWYEIDPCYVFHPLNAYEDGQSIVLDVCRFEKLSLDLGDGAGSPPRLHRFTIDREAGKVREEPLDDRAGDFPRVHDRVVGLRHRYGYLAGMGEEADSLGSELRKYDLESGSSVTHGLPAGCQAGEPVFAAAPDGRGEDEGWVLTFVYDAGRDRSDLVILDATRFDAEPVARIHLPARVPFGFHGSWIPDED